MGHSVQTATQLLHEFERDFAHFRRALRLEDRHALDDLVLAARRHLAAVSYSGHALPYEIFMIAMLVEMQKDVARLRGEVERLRTQEP